MTLIKADVLELLLNEAGCNPEKANLLCESFQTGFDLHYEGPMNRKNISENLPMRVGNAADMWQKIMKEVKLKRYAGPVENIPFENFVQSPIGLVPKAKNKMRLFFHLSYDFKDFLSVNAYTPKCFCTVKYKDLDHAVKNCLELQKRWLQTYGRQNWVFDGIFFQKLT